MIDVGIIGLGRFGRRLVDSVQGKSDRIRFTKAVVRTPGKVADYAAKKGIALGTDLDALLGDPALDALLVVSGGPNHPAHGLAAIRAGKPVMIIKPMALKGTDARALRDEAESRGQLLALGYNRCYLPVYAELRRLVADGDLGTALHAEGAFCVDRYGHAEPDDWKLNQANIPPGSLTDHMLYEMIRILGPVAEVHALGGGRAKLPTLLDTTATQLRFENGATGLLTAIGTTARFGRLHVFGTGGWAEVREMNDLVTGFTKTQADLKADATGGTRTFPDCDPEYLQLEGFADAVEGKAVFPITGEQAAHSVAVLEAIHRSVVEGKTVAVEG